MHISFERSGGIAGRTIRVNLDSSELAPEAAQQLEELVRRSGFFQLQAPASTPAKGGADRFQYVVTVEHEGRRHSIEMREDAVPPSARPLLEWLTRQARQSKNP